MNRSESGFKERKINSTDSAYYNSHEEMRENRNKDAKLGNDLNDGMAGTKSRRGRVESIE